MKRNVPDRDVAFRHEDGCLVRVVSGSDGRTYTHRCSLQAFERTAWAIAETPHDGDGIAGHEIAAAEDLPYTQVDVALSFLHERNIIDRRHRRNYPATDQVHLDAMVEWHALREEPGEACDPTGTACPTCGDAHPPCRRCGAPTRCPPDEVGEPFLHCDACDAGLPR